MILTPDDGDARALRRSVRFNNLASLTSVLLSGAALLVALRQGGHGGAQPAALAAAAAAREKHVDSPAPEGEIHIPGLAIYQGQIVDAAVGSRELEDGAVTAPKLAAGAVTLASLGADVTSSLARAVGAGVTGSIVAGEVRAGGCEVSSGVDFTAEKVEGGAHGDVCTLRFVPPLDRVPVVVVTATSYGKCYSRDVTPSAATIKCQTDLLSSAPSDAFLGFTFVAAEPGLGVAPSPPPPSAE